MPSILINQSLYFRKSVLGDNRANELESVPVQLVYPNGNVQIGLPQNARVTVPSNNDNQVVVVSGPEKFATDYRVRDALALSLVCMGLLNIILTCVMFGYASVVDPSKVVPVGVNPNMVNEFQVLQNERTGREDANVIMIVSFQVLAVLSAILHSSFGLSIYSLGLVLNYLLSMSSIPYFAYSSRFILDAVMLYLALVLRSKLMYIYLPLDVKNITADY